MKKPGMPGFFSTEHKNIFSTKNTKVTKRVKQAKLRKGSSGSQIDQLLT
ncbi:MAG: hypothetical protein WCK93_12545 [Nitrosomonadales bacterium]